MFTWLTGIITAIPLFFTYRILSGLGLAIFVTTGLTLAVTSAFDLLATRLSGMPADVLALMTIAGVPSALGILAGAITSGFAVRALTKSISLGLSS